MTGPLVSIILPTYNRSSFLERAIESVLDQSYSNWELIISDDASEDQTPEICRSWQAKDRRIVYIRGEKNVGIAGNINRALRVARGKYAALLDDDDCWADSQKLEKQVNFLEKNPEYVGVGGGMIVRDATGKELFRYLQPETDSAIRKTMLFSNPMANSTMMFVRTAAEKVGFYDESINWGADRDFWLKMARIGKLHNLPEYFAYYTVSGQNSLFRNQRELFLSSLNIIKRYKKDYPYYFPALIFHYGLIIYSLLPSRLRTILNMPLYYLKRVTFGRKGS